MSEHLGKQARASEKERARERKVLENNLVDYSNGYVEAGGGVGMLRKMCRYLASGWT